MGSCPRPWGPSRMAVILWAPPLQDFSFQAAAVHVCLPTPQPHLLQLTSEPQTHQGPREMPPLSGWRAGGRRARKVCHDSWPPSPFAGGLALRPAHHRGQWGLPTPGPISPHPSGCLPRQVKGECLLHPCPEVSIFSLQLWVSLDETQHPMAFTLP